MCTAYHEAGHTLVAYFTKDATPLHKVTIVPRGTSLGHVSHAGHLCAVDYGCNDMQYKTAVPFV